MKRKYEQHLNKIEGIVNQKTHPIVQQAKEMKKMDEKRKKAHQMNKNFREEEIKTARRK